MRERILLPCLIAALLCIACGQEETEQEIAVESISLGNTYEEMEPGHTLQLTANVLPADATDKSVRWSTSDPSVATVDQTGIVAAIDEGVATVVAKAGSVSATCTIKVIRKVTVVEVASISLDRDELELTEGESVRLAATVLPEDASEKTVSWSTSDLAVAEVDGAGNVTAVAPGSATITAGAGSKSAECAVTVRQRIIAVTAILLSNTDLTLTEGDSRQLTATVLPDDAADREVFWNSTDENVAAVSESGLVTAIHEGTAIIVARAAEVSVSCRVTVNRGYVAVESVILDRTCIELAEGESVQLAATVLPEDASEKTVSWSTSDPAVAEVDGAGNVTAVAPGSATITAGAGSKSAECAVAVRQRIIAVTAILLSNTDLTLTEGDSRQLTATVLPEDATENVITWSSTDNAIVDVTQQGRITALAAGTADITASAGGITASCRVTVREIPFFGLSQSFFDIPTDGGEIVVDITSNVHFGLKSKPVWISDSGFSRWDDGGGRWFFWVSSNYDTGGRSGEIVFWTDAGEDSRIAVFQKGLESVPVETVTLNCNEVTLPLNETVKLYAAVLPDDADWDFISWRSTDPAVVSIGTDNGTPRGTAATIMALRPGSCDIIAEAGGKTATCHVNVPELPFFRMSNSHVNATSGGGEIVIDIESNVEYGLKSCPDWVRDNGLVKNGDRGRWSFTILPNAGSSARNGAIVFWNDAVGDTSFSVFQTGSEEPAYIPVQSVSLSETGLTLTLAETKKLSVTVLPLDATRPEVHWWTEGDAIALLNDGEICAICAGQAVVYAEADGVTASCIVTVQEIPVESITLDKAECSVTAGDSFRLYARISPENASSQTIVWSTSDAAVANVDNLGYVQTFREGDVDITASAGGKSVTCHVKVSSAAGLVINLPEQYTVGIGDIIGIVAQFVLQDIPDREIVWTCTNENVVAPIQEPEVYDWGVLMAYEAKSVGEADIIARAGDNEARSHIIVKRVESITLSQTALSLNQGETASLTATVDPDNFSVNWSSSDTGVVTVHDGQVTAVGGGTARIKVSAGQLSVFCEVVVKGEAVDIRVQAASNVMNIDQSQKLSVRTVPGEEYLIDNTIVWSSSDEGIATVDSNGVVTARGGGLVTITASIGSVSGSISITVHPDSGVGSEDTGFEDWD